MPAAEHHTVDHQRTADADLAGYEVVWRPTIEPFWTHAIPVGDVSTATVDLSKDNVVFGVRAIDTAGQGLVEITDRVLGWVAAQGMATGLLTLFCRHTSASLLIQ